MALGLRCLSSIKLHPGNLPALVCGRVCGQGYLKQGFLLDKLIKGSMERRLGSQACVPQDWTHQMCSTIQTR